MKDKHIIAVSVIVSLAGIIVLFFISRSFDPATPEGSEYLKNTKEDSSVWITGKVIDITNGNNFTIVTLEYKEKTKVVVFDHIDLRIGDSVGVSGIIEEYHGEEEIIADWIEKGNEKKPGKDQLPRPTKVI